MTNENLPSKKKLAIVRTVTVWASYDPATREIDWLSKYKYNVPVIRGCHVIQLKGHYVPVRK